MSNHRRISCIAAALSALAVSCAVVTPALAAPPNDNYTNAVALGSALSIGSSVDLTGATSEVFEQHPSGVTYTTAWFTWTAPADGRVQVTACTPDGTVRDDVEVYQGSSLPTLIELSTFGGPLCSGGKAFVASAGTKYSLQIDGTAGKPHAGPTPVNIYERTSSQTTATAPAAVTGDTEGAGTIVPGGFVFFGFDWAALSSTNGLCAIDGATTHVTVCRDSGLTYSGLSAGTHTATFAGLDPWGFYSAQATTTITIPLPKGQPPLQPAPKQPAPVDPVDPAATATTPAVPPTVALVTPIAATDSPAPCLATPVVRSAARLSLRTLRRRGARVTLAAHAGCVLKLTLSVVGHRGTLAEKGVVVATALTVKPSRTAIKHLHIRRGSRLRITVTSATAAHRSITVRVTA